MSVRADIAGVASCHAVWDITPQLESISIPTCASGGGAQTLFRGLDLWPGGEWSGPYRDLLPTRLRASSKQGPTTIAGLDGQFSLAGRVEAGAVQFVLVAEYFANKKPLCQQSWNVSGVKRAR